MNTQSNPPKTVEQLPAEVKAWWDARQPPDLGGVFERTRGGGYRMPHPEKFEKFLDALRRWRDALAEWRRVAPYGLPLSHRKQFNKMFKHGQHAAIAKLLKSPRLHDVQAGWSKRIENLKQDADEAKRKFESKYRPIALALWRTTDGDLPFFNPIFFPKHNKGKSAFFDMATIVQQICMIEKGRSSGAPSDTRALRPDEQVTVEKMSRAKKGVAYISEEIGIEKRQMSDRRWKRSNPTLKKAVRRHLKRRSLS